MTTVDDREEGPEETPPAAAIEELRSKNEELSRANEDLRRKVRRLERTRARGSPADTKRLELAWNAARGGVYEHAVPPDDTTYLSREWLQVLGYRPGEVPSDAGFLDWLDERVHEEDREGLHRAYNDLAAGLSDSYEVDLRIRHRAGHWVWVRSLGRPLEKAEDGRARRILRMMIDITELKRTEESLRESELRFREMANGLPLIVWVHDESGEQELVNDTFLEFFGVTREQTTGGHWQMFLHPEDAEAYRREFYACIADQRPFHAEARVRHADGSWRWLESWGRPRRGPTGDFKGFIGASADVTDRRRMEEALRDSEERFRTLADGIPQLAWMTDRDGWIFWYNKRWYDYTGTTFDEVKGWGWRTVHHPDHIEGVAQRFRDAIESGRVWEDTFPLRSRDGNYRWFLSRAVPVRDDDGAIVRWFGTNTDITERRSIERKLIDADRQKDRFLAMLGHELRNPLAAIRTASETLKLKLGNQSALARTQSVIERQSEHMAKLLDSLLDVSRIIFGKIRIDPETVDLSAVCRELGTWLKEQIGERELELVVNVPTQPVWVQADPVRLRQMIDNLLSNALKYTPEGGRITIGLSRRERIARLMVRDTGIGIPPDLLPHVFEAFRQSEQSMDRAQGGLGLGLALVKTLAELHDGSVTARSEGQGAGAEFVLELPLSGEVEEAQAPEADHEESPALRILIIEDNEDAAEMLGAVLELSGHRIAIVDRGAEGVRSARADPPDLILCDLGLPDGMTGFDVAAKIRTHPATRAIPLIALSGYGRPEDKEKSLEAGFDMHLTKPAGIEDLKRAIAGVRPESTPGGPAESSSS